MAGKDLARMERGEVDPGGREETERAQDLAERGILLGVVGGLVFVGMVLEFLGVGRTR